MRTKIISLLAGLFCLLTLSSYAQSPESLMAPLPTDKVLGTISYEMYGGQFYYYKQGISILDKETGYERWVSAGTTESDITFSGKDAEKFAISEAKTRYPAYEKEMYQLRNINWTRSEIKKESNHIFDRYNYIYRITATVVKPGGASSSSSSSGKTSDPLSKALNKALQDIRDGSRIAIDQVRVTSDMDRNDYKDRVVELLLDKGFKVVAKDYLDKLYEEQKAQQSGKYNDRTVAQMGNFTGIGYYLNVRVTEETLRIQVINVSTGEYEGNVTVNL